MSRAMPRISSVGDEQKDFLFLGADVQRVSISVFIQVNMEVKLRFAQQPPICSLGLRRPRDARQNNRGFSALPSRHHQLPSLMPWSWASS